MKIDALQGGMRYINGDVSHVFSHIRTAQNIQSTLVSQASGIANGAMGVAGYALDNLANKIGRPSTQDVQVAQATTQQAAQNQAQFNSTGRATGPK